MASKEDDNKLRFNSNVNNDREVNIINVYKRLEFVLNNKTESFPNKVESLVQVWKQVSQCRLTEHKQYVVHLMDWLKLHTLNIVLTGDWKKFKDIYEEKLLKEVKHCEMLLLHSNNIFSLRCRKLAEVIKDPWGSPILNRLLNDPDVVIGPQEIEFFCIETGYLISTRLRKLCESHCEDMALNLVSTFMRCHQMAEAQHSSLNATEDQKRFILDVYVALLYKYKKTALIITTLKSLTLKEGLELLKRFAHKRVNISKIWRHSNRIAHLAAQVYITATVMKPPEESVSILEALLETWLSLNETTENLESLMSAIRRIIQAAESAVHLYIFCEAVYKKFGLTMKTFTIELYIRALTTGMNDLERQKNEDDSIKVTETTQQLAHGFLRLADVLEEHVKVSRECVLTSFSLQPTEETLQRIVRIAERCGYELLDTGQNWKCKLHPPVHPTDDICWKCDLCGDFMSQPHFETPLNTNTALNEALTAEQLGLSSQLCDDLVVVLSSPRYQLFNWLLRWQDLHRLCVLYLNDPEGTKNLVTELKFLDIDYSMFVGVKREPEDEELTGIERGYEHYLEDELYPEERISPTSEDSFSQDSRPYSLGSDGMGEHVSLLPLPSGAKSDPNVLKSLRLFRPNLKRTKPSQLESVLPPKVFVTSKSVSPLTTAQTTISTAQHGVGSVENLSALMDKYIGSYNLLPTLPPKTFLTNKSIPPRTTAQPTFSTAHHNVRQDNFHALVNKYLGYDTSINVLSNQPRTCIGGRSGNWDAPGQCSSSSGRSSVVANTYATQEENRLNSTREEYNFLASNSNVQPDRHCSVNSSRLDNLKVEPRKPSMKQMFTEMEQALDYLKQRKNEKVLDVAASDSRCSLNLTKEISNNQQSVHRNLNKYVSDDSQIPQHLLIKEDELRKKDVLDVGRTLQQSSNFIGESHLIRELNYPRKSDILKNVLEDKIETNRVKHDRVENSKMQNFLLDHKNSDSPEKQFISQLENNCTTSDSSEGRTGSRKNLEESSYKNRRSAISISCVNLSSSVPCPKTANVEVGPKQSSTTDKSSKDLSKIILRLGSGNAVPCPKPANVEDGPKQSSTMDKSSTKDLSKSILRLGSGNAVPCPKTANVEDGPKQSSTMDKSSTKDLSKSILRLGSGNAVPCPKTAKVEDGPKQSSTMDKSSTKDLSKSILRLGSGNAVPCPKTANVEDAPKQSSTMDKSSTKDLSKSILRLGSGNAVPCPKTAKVEDGPKQSSTMDKSSKDLSKIILRLGSGNAKNLKELPADVPIPTVETSKNLPASATSNTEGVGDLTLKVPVHCVDSSKTVLPSVSDNERNKQNQSNSYVEPSKNVLPSPDNDGENKQNHCSDVPIPVETSKNVSLSPDNNEECLSSDVSLPVNISKNLISASSGTEDGEICITLPVPCVDESKYLLTFGSSDAKNEENHCLHEMKSIDYKTSTEKHLINEVENVVPVPKTQLRKYSRAKRNSLSGVSDSGATVLERDKSTDLKKKFNLKEVRVILHRLSLSECYKKKYIKPASKFVRPATPKRTQPKREQKKVAEKSENKTKDKRKRKADNNKSKNGLKPWPLQDLNPKVNRCKDINSHVFKDNKCKTDFKTDLKLMNPCVVLKRLEFDKDKKRSANSVLANVPGLNDLQMIRPSSVDRIVQVVQVPGARSTTSIPIQSTQTSTQVTPHIQRIGQPRTEKPEASVPDSTSITSTAASSTSTTTTTTDSPTLINILSQQIIRPGSQANCVGVRPRTSPLINILSQQIIKPATSITPSAKVSSSGSTEVQVNSIPRVISGGDQILSQLINPVRAPAPTLKTLVNAPASDHNRIVQFICKSSDGKLIPVTSFTSNKVVKVSMTQTVSTSVPSNTSANENLTKAPQTTPKIKTEPAENPDTLPKFQQAFGKPAYQNNIDSTECVTTNSDNVNTDIEKSGNVVKNQPKNSSTSLNVQPVQGGVIYTRQMPVGQTINLIPPGRGQVFRIATSNAEQLSLVKDTVIHGKMSALLAAALQGKQHRTVDSEIDITSEENSQSSTRVALTTRPALVQNARIVKPVLQIPSNVIRSTPQSNLSSTTLEQLREFDMVYKQVKERSSTSAPTESSPQSDSNEPTTQQISVTYVNQGQKINCSPVVVVSSYCNVQPAASPSLSVTSQGSSSPCVTPAPTLALSKTVSKSPKTKSVKSTTTHTTKASPIPKPQQKPQEDEHTTQRIFDILAEYAEQLRNSPDLNNKPAPRRRSNPPTNPNQNAKRKKSSSSKKTGHCSNSLASDGDLEDTHTVGSEDSSCGVVQISVQEEEQPLTAVTTSETSEASVSPKQLILTDSTANQSRSLIIADSNVGEALKMSNTAVLVPGNYIMPVSMVKGGQQIAVVSGGSKILATVPARSGPNMLLFQSFLNQTRKHGLPTVKYSAVQPIAGIARNLATVTAQAPTAAPPTSQNLTAVTLAQTVALQKVNQLDRTDINSFDTELLLTIAHPPENKSNIITEQPQPELRGISSSSESVQTIRVGDSILNTDSSLEKTFAYEEKALVNTSVATSVIAQSISIKEEKLSEEEQSTTQTIMALNLNSSDGDKDTTIKVEGRVQSVLVATGTSNGPMLFNSPPTYNKQTDSTNSISESNKDEYLRNEGKRNSSEAKSLQSTVYAYQGKIKKNQAGSHRLDRELQQLSLQRKQAALERELRLQKSLSEECEDLGVDEPSTSDLFPEADLLFDSNHSPSFDQTSQDLVKRPPNTHEVKEETKTIGLFCDDEPMRTDFLFEPIEYQSGAVELDYNRSRDMTNGQGSTSNESGYSCEDNTLLQTCTSMSDVTIPSPISPDPYTDNSPPPLNKCKYKYSNRKKAERSKQVENWPMELSSSEDTTGSTELAKSCSRSPEVYPGRRNRSLSCEEDDRDLIGFTIVERLPLKEEEECEELHCQEAVDCPSGRGARRSVKKLCSCCNGSTKVARKRPASRPPTPFSHKKTVIAKKR